MELSGQGQMETGGIGQNGDIRRLGRTDANELVHFAQDAGDMRNHLKDPDHCERPLVHHRANSGGLHPRTGASEKLGFGMPSFQHFDQAGSVQIPGSFAGGDEDAHLPPV